MVIYDSVNQLPVAKVNIDPELGLWNAIDMVGIWHNPEEGDEPGVWYDTCEINGKKYHCNDLDYIPEDCKRYAVKTKYMDFWYGGWMSVDEIEIDQYVGYDLGDLLDLAADWDVTIEDIMDEVEEIPACRSVEYSAGESTDGSHGVDYMLLKLPFGDDLYAEVDADPDDEIGTYFTLKDAIINLARDRGINPEILEFCYD